ncbi:unnamed protein product [Camellia sinensis]
MFINFVGLCCNSSRQTPCKRLGDSSTTQRLHGLSAKNWSSIRAVLDLQRLKNMEGVVDVDVDVDATIAEMVTKKRGRKKVNIAERKKTGQGRKKKVQSVAMDGESLPSSAEGHNDNNPLGITVSMFDYSVKNHFRAMNRIRKLCGEAECDDLDKREFERLSSSITFIREWTHFNYQPRVVRFACQNESSPQGKDVIGGIALSQFSAATVPKKDGQDGNILSPVSSKDFVMYVGGSVWALDWCPRVHQHSDHHTKCEFIAIAAHPPESFHHKLGAPLIGRGIIQIWCILNVGAKEEEVPQMEKKTKQNSRKSTTEMVISPQPKKPRGKPRKKPINESVDNLDGNNEYVQALAVQFSENSSQPKKPRGIPRNKPINESVDNLDGNNEYVQPLAVQFSENSSQPKKPRGIPRKKPINEPVDNLDGNNEYVQALAVQFSENSSQPKKPRGRPRKKPINESVDNLDGNNEYVQPLAIQFSEYSSQPKKSRGRPRKKPINESVDNLDGNNEYVQPLAVQFSESSSQPKKPRGRSWNKPINESVDNLDGDNEYVQALAVQISEKSSQPKKPRGRPWKKPINESVGMVAIDTHEHVTKKGSGRTWEGCRQGVSADNSVLASSVKSTKLHAKSRADNFMHDDGLPLLTQNENRESSLVNPIACLNSGQDHKNGSLESSVASCLIPKDAALPRVVLCLAHNGKVAWDVKWRPSNACDMDSKHRMGYLAVLLGSGALEVWEIPHPQTMKFIYSTCEVEGTDPRFVKLEPIFRCSKLKCGDRQSIPLTVEWSTSCHDFILAGCHDGVVALWKFSVNGISEDTRPLLCFSADTVPIRALAWAPVESDPESANVIVTAGHRGLKFWDIRDPFRPLWDLNPVQRIIYSLDWLADPSCVIVSFDDGTLRILSLSKAAYDVPVTGKPFVGTQQQGFHSYYCSSFAIWSVQVSRLTGMVAYCSADGTVLRFQLTTKAVEKDPLRNRAPHFLCGYLSEEESTLTVITPLPDTPFPMKKSLNEWSNAPRTIRGFLSVSNQAKRAKEQMTKGQTFDGQTLALCHGDDTGIEIGSEDTLVSPKSKQTPKSKTSGKKKLTADDQALVCRDEETENVERGDSEKGETVNEIEVFPPKIVAMHRVRWNMNKGSERWLCSGGAGGIVRCQEI